MLRRPPRSSRTDTLFPYTTLFRSRRVQSDISNEADRPYWIPAFAGMTGDRLQDAPSNRSHRQSRRLQRGPRFGDRVLAEVEDRGGEHGAGVDRKSTRLNSSH